MSIDSRVTALSNELAQTQVLLEQAADNQADLSKLVYELTEEVQKIKDNQLRFMRKTIDHLTELQDVIDKRTG